MESDRIKAIGRSERDAYARVLLKSIPWALSEERRQELQHREKVGFEAGLLVRVDRLIAVGERIAEALEALGARR